MQPVARYLHTMVRITDPGAAARSTRRSGWSSAATWTSSATVSSRRRTTSSPSRRRARTLELTFNHDGRTYDLGTGYGHVAIGVDDLDGTLARLAEQGIEPERPPYTVREGGSRLCFVRDPDGYRIELIERA